MKKKFAFAASLFAGVCAVGTWAMSDDKKAPDAQPAGGMDPAMMENWQKYMTPNEHHKAMENMAGKFTYSMSFKMDPSQEWQTSDGEYEGKLIFGGRFLTTSVKGPMMGENFEGMGVLGYDNGLKKHISIWCDNMGTGVMRAEGTCDGAGKVITFEGEQPDPMMGGKITKYKFVYDIPSADEFSMRWWSPGPTGEMFESMKIMYKRVK